jgi:hypothetical protein
MSARSILGKIAAKRTFQTISLTMQRFRKLSLLY